MAVEKVIDGTYFANQILDQLKCEIASINNGARQPSFAIILVGDNFASQVYVNKKINTCESVGIRVQLYKYSDTVTQEELASMIIRLNNDNNIDAILVQLPLPISINNHTILDLIAPNKDVDGLCSTNIGRLLKDQPYMRPCTAYGIMQLIKSMQIILAGKHAVIIGSSNIVGKPISIELLNSGATVTVCHSKTNNIKQLTILADILIVAVGQPRMVKKDWIKPGCIVFDVGINKFCDKICGDVDYEDVFDKVQCITPVPGGVGPMTIASLMQNIFYAYNFNRLNYDKEYKL
jgi:methylenetetrahydrofolate dehydrogenase (NADP+)/methenyltetrahydrofolate cyclohydrolase